MPHVIVKLWPGKTKAQKHELADAITKDVMAVLNYGEASVSVSFEEVEASRWREDVYEKDIITHPERLIKKPGYAM
ncbi:tautomerase family protein [Martelella sp. FOR1707]